MFLLPLQVYSIQRVAVPGLHPEGPIVEELAYS